MKEEGESERHNCGAVAWRQWTYVGLDHCATEGVLLVWFSVGFLLALAFQGGADAPDAAIGVVLEEAA